MASTYPGSLDAFDSIASDKKTSDVVGGRTHRDMHNDLGDAIEAVQAELGTDPAGTFATVKARLDQAVAYAAKSGAYTATVADHTLNVTSGTFTLDLPAASTCTGQSLKVKNSGTGVVTLDGNSSETVEGVATFPLGPGSYVEITSTGSAWILTGGRPDTGWRNVDAGLINSWTGNIRLRRQGDTVVVWFALNGTSATNNTPLVFASGFRVAPTIVGNYGILGSLVTAPTAVAHVLNSGPANAIQIESRAASISGFLTWPTPDAWPTSLPGSAA